MIKDWLKEKKAQIKLFFDNYGRIFAVGVCLILIFVSLYFIFGANNEKDFKVVFFDVGQGDAIFIETPSGKQMLIDGGPNDKVLQKLDSEMSIFDRDIDVVVATHADADHVTGLIPVLEKYKVKNIIESNIKGKTATFNDLEKHIQDEVNDGAILHIANVGDEIDFKDGVIARVLYPRNADGRRLDADQRRQDADTGTNENSVSILLTYEDKSFLFTGDLPTIRENKLIESKFLPQNITVYKAGHHGSKSSSGDYLLSYIKPYYSVISAGKNNRYGHPNIETIERLKKYSKVILSTIESGDVSFILKNKTLVYKVKSP